MTKINVCNASCAVLLLCASTVIAAQAQTFTTLVHFKGPNGDSPSSPLIQGRDGALYGTTQSGGANSEGEAFRMSSTGRLTIYSFCSQPGCVDGSNPDAIVLGLDGVFYGTAAGGGATGNGTVFKITRSGQLTTLYSFCAQTGCPDGSDPDGLLVGEDGNLYGTTVAGGTSNQGTIFKITPMGSFSSLHSFYCSSTCLDGAWPNPGMIQASDGNFYGTTYAGGESSPNCEYGINGCGTVFRITPRGAQTTLYRFCSSRGCPDGNNPRGGPVEAADGGLYGSTYGTLNESGGTIFNITKAGVLSTVYTFCSNCVDEDGPTGEIVQATDGNLYGTTLLGGRGPEGNGTMFELTTAGVLTTLYNFCAQQGCRDGSSPLEGVMQHTSGVLYGSTIWGGGGDCKYNGCGALFSLDAGLPSFVTFVIPAGKIGQVGGILGQGFTGTTNVDINGVPANFTVVSDTYLTATVPSGATTGYVTVTTPTGVLTSNVPFRVIQ